MAAAIELGVPLWRCKQEILVAAVTSIQFNSFVLDFPNIWALLTNSGSCISCLWLMKIHISTLLSIHRNSQSIIINQKCYQVLVRDDFTCGL
ncbi:hypothetical protein Ahy_B01g055142 isoform G [Arachis hypogaea]|uniref:Uncharacterized protein n=1 Tax=Arachis hypogaea TaxID=3818 RepID=A0A445AVF1_ARAHY|nr:hypothetical protein Ahy_B01g055142 isoform G [Arachis hypogaea]